MFVESAGNSFLGIVPCYSKFAPENRPDKNPIGKEKVFQPSIFRAFAVSFREGSWEICGAMFVESAGNSFLGIVPCYSKFAPETNKRIAPENRPDKNPIGNEKVFQPSIFRGVCC